MTVPATTTDAGSWRLACPHGHVSLIRRRATTDKTLSPTRWFCRTCGDHYQTVRDKKTGKQVSP